VTSDTADLGRVAYLLYREQPPDGYDNDVRAAQEALILNLLPRIVEVINDDDTEITDRQAEAILDTLPTHDLDGWRDEVREIVRDELCE
jgi:hypothetical protein